jgi:hypothetical protein
MDGTPRTALVSQTYILTEQFEKLVCQTSGASVVNKSLAFAALLAMDSSNEFFLGVEQKGIFSGSHGGAKPRCLRFGCDDRARHIPSTSTRPCSYDFEVFVACCGGSKPCPGA